MDGYRKQIFISVAYAAVGLVLTLRPGMAASVVCTLLGVCALIFGAARLIMYFARREERGASEAAVGAAFAAVGALCLAAPRLVMSILPLALGVVLAIDGAGKLSRALELRKLGWSNWYWTLLLALCLLIVGVTLVINPFGMVETAVMFFGICLLIDGVADIALLLLGRK